MEKIKIGRKGADETEGNAEEKSRKRYTRALDEQGKKGRRRRGWKTRPVARREWLRQGEKKKSGKRDDVRRLGYRWPKDDRGVKIGRF